MKGASRASVAQYFRIARRQSKPFYRGWWAGAAQGIACALDAETIAQSCRIMAALENRR